MQYEHTQRAPLHYLMYPIAGVVLLLAWNSRAEQGAWVALMIVAALIVLIGFCFQSLTVTDEGDRLALRYGPIPVFWKTFRYAAMSSVEAGRSSLIDGWGIHWVPGRGWTYNLWGFDCVVIHQGSRISRVGSDDVPQLLAFLNERLRTVPKPQA